MDLASLLGIVICLALVIFGIVAGNGFGVIVNFLDLNSALITFGGAFCSVMASNTMPDFVAGIKAIGLIFKAQSADTPEVTEIWMMLFLRREYCSLSTVLIPNW